MKAWVVAAVVLFLSGIANAQSTCTSSSLSPCLDPAVNSAGQFPGSSQDAPTCSTTGILTLPMNCPAGDVAIANIFDYFSGAVTTPGGWSVGANNSISALRMLADWKAIDSTDPNTITLTTSLGATGVWCGVVQCWMAANGADPFDLAPPANPGVFSTAHVSVLDAPSVGLTNFQNDTMVGMFVLPDIANSTPFTNPSPTNPTSNPCDPTQGACVTFYGNGTSSTKNNSYGLTQWQGGLQAGSNTGDMTVQMSRANSSGQWGAAIYSIVSVFAGPPPTQTPTATPTCTPGPGCVTPTASATPTLTPLPTPGPTPATILRGGRIGQAPNDVLNTSRQLINNGDFSSGLTGWGSTTTCWNADTSHPPPGVTHDLEFHPLGATCGTLVQKVNTSVLPPAITGQTHFQASIFIDTGTCKSPLTIGLSDPTTGNFWKTNTSPTATGYQQYTASLYGGSQLAMTISANSANTSCIAFIGNVTLNAFDFPYVWSVLEYPNDGMQWSDQTNQIWVKVHVTPRTPNTGAVPSVVQVNGATDYQGLSVVTQSANTVLVPEGNGTFDADVKWTYSVPYGTALYLYSTVYDANSVALATDLVPSASSPNFVGSGAPWWIIGAGPFGSSLTPIGRLQNLIGPDDNIYMVDALGSWDGATMTLSNSQWGSYKAPNYAVGDIIWQGDNEYQHGRITSVDHTTGVVGIDHDPYWTWSNQPITHATVQSDMYQQALSQSGCLGCTGYTTASQWQANCFDGSGNLQAGICLWTANGGLAPTNNVDAQPFGPGAVINYTPFGVGAAATAASLQSFSQALFQIGLGQEGFMWSGLDGRIAITLNAGSNVVHSADQSNFTQTAFNGSDVEIPNAGPNGTTLITKITSTPTQFINLTADSTASSQCIVNASNLTNVAVGDPIFYELRKHYIRAINNVPATGTTCTGGDTIQISPAPTLTQVGAAASSWSFTIANAASVSVAFNGTLSNSGNLYLDFDGSSAGVMNTYIQNFSPASTYPGVPREYPCDECAGNYAIYPAQAKWYYFQRYTDGQHVSDPVHAATGYGTLDLWRYLPFADAENIDTYPVARAIFGFPAKCVGTTNGCAWFQPGVMNVDWAHSSTCASPGCYDHRVHGGVLPSFYGTGGNYPIESEFESMVWSVLSHGGKVWKWWKGLGNASGAPTDPPWSFDTRYGAGVDTLGATANINDTSLTVNNGASWCQAGLGFRIGKSGTTADSAVLQASKCTGNVISLAAKLLQGPYSAGAVILSAAQKNAPVTTANANVRACAANALNGIPDPGAASATAPAISGVTQNIPIYCWIGYDGSEYCAVHNEGCVNVLSGASRACVVNSTGVSSSPANTATISFHNALSSQTVTGLCPSATYTATGGVLSVALGADGTATDHQVLKFSIPAAASPTVVATETPTPTSTGSPTPSTTPTISPTPSATTSTTPTASPTPGQGWYLP